MTTTASKVARMGKSKRPVNNQGTPMGDFGEFLRAAIKGDSDRREQIAEHLGKSAETIRKWEQGLHGPAFAELGLVAEALGYKSWYELVAAIKRRS